MLLIKLLRFISGYVSFRAEGGFPERFINLCSLNRINLWNLNGSGGSLAACTDLRSYKRIRPTAKKAGMRLQVTGKNGLPFILGKHKNRFGLLVGVWLFLIIFPVLSSRIWTVSVLGSNNVAADDIIAALAEEGVKPGAKKSDISAFEIRTEALKKLPGLSWLYVNISGSKAVIEVREVQQRPPKEDERICDLVAAQDGRLSALRVFNGRALVEPGSAVLKGDVLISAVEENRDGTPDITGAEGYAEAVVPLKFTSSSKAREKLVVRQAVKTKLALNFFSLTAGNSRAEKNKICFTEEKYLFLNSVKLPLGIIRTVVYDEKEKSVSLSPEQYELLALSRFFESICDELRKSEIRAGQTRLIKTAGAACITAEFDCLQNIGVKRELPVIENAGNR